MSAEATQAKAGSVGVLLTANERFKRSFGAWFWGSMILATVAHFAVFALWPEMTAEDVSYDAAELEAIELFWSRCHELGGTPVVGIHMEHVNVFLSKHSE